MSTRRDLLIGAGAAGVAAPAFAQGGAVGPVSVVATFSILADVIAQVGGPLARVTPLVGADRDAHHYDPRPGDLRRIASADLVARSGLGFEGWMDRLIASAGYRGPVLTASTGIAPIFVRGSTPDPHVWQGFDTLKIYALNAAGGLRRVRPAGRDAFVRGYLGFVERIEAARREASARMARVPADRRLVVVPHNSFRYLGREIGVEFRGLRALSTAAQPSAADLARLVTDIRASGAAAFFVENIGDERLMAEVARETGATLGGRLFSDALSGPDGPAANAVDMLRENVRLIADALTR